MLSQRVSGGSTVGRGCLLSQREVHGSAARHNLDYSQSIASNSILLSPRRCEIFLSQPLPTYDPAPTQTFRADTVLPESLPLHRFSRSSHVRKDRVAEFYLRSWGSARLQHTGSRVRPSKPRTLSLNIVTPIMVLLHVSVNNEPRDGRSYTRADNRY